MRSVTEIDKLLMDSGFECVRQDKHRIWRCPCGHIQITSQSTPCRGRGDQNLRAKVRRALRGCQPA